MPTAEIKRHWDQLASLGCMVTGDKHNVTMHHCHGGSMKLRGVHRSTGRKTSDWLVIPLRFDLHIGPKGIDGPPGKPSVAEWEEKWGAQAEMLDRVVLATGVNVWARALERPVRKRKKAR